MAKLTLSFKGRLLSVHHLDERPATIGRDADCAIRIDSLAVAPRHVELMPTAGIYLLLGLDTDYPVLLNGERVDQATLNHDDEIQLGKHTLHYAEDNVVLSLPRIRPVAAAQPVPDEPAPPPAVEVVEEDDEEPVGGPVPAYIQVQSGPQIGRVITFRRSVTRLNRAGAADIIVTRQGDSYYLLRLGGQAIVRIAGARVTADGEVKLNDNDLVEIGELRFRFFAGRSGDSSPVG